MRVDVEFSGFVDAPGPTRRASYDVSSCGDRFTLTVNLPESVAGSLLDTVKRDEEDREEFRQRLEDALAQFGREYARRIAEDDDLRRVAVRDGHWDHAVAGHELYRLRQLLR